MIDKTISRITHQIDDIMNFVRIKPQVINEIDVISIIDMTLKSITIPKGISINVEPSNIKIKCDSKQLDIVLNNLITNAIESINYQGTITVLPKNIDALEN